jgi:hypothetical protein
LIKVADYTEKLDRLNNIGSDSADDEADAEFDRICEELFDATVADIIQADLDRLEAKVTDPKATITYCRSLGYDLIIRDQVPVVDWEDFAIMIMAKAEGLLPKTPEERAERRLEAEAAEFVLSAC